MKEERSNYLDFSRRGRGELNATQVGNRGKLSGEEGPESRGTNA